MKKTYFAIPVAVLWALLTICAWLHPAQEVSQSERRQLAQMPAFNVSQVANGTFMTKFGEYALDQFPFREEFRTLKALFHTKALGQQDNNDLYCTADGFAVRQEYPLNLDSVNHALRRFQKVYDLYLADCQVYMAAIPDKNYYLGPQTGHLTLDYETMFARLREGMPWAEHIDLTGLLSAQDYYRTDTHWRQERLIPVAQEICRAMGVPEPEAGDFTRNTLDFPFLGVYYGQAALPMAPETITLLESPALAACTVQDFETGKTLPVYNLDRLTGRDPYDVYLAGAKALLTICNPNAKTDRELVIFRDSFGSSLAPLLLSDYAQVTLVDIRYIRPEDLSHFITFADQDVLFLYSTLVLNSSAGIR